jgi:hypothetical protein
VTELAAPLLQRSLIDVLHKPARFRVRGTENADRLRSVSDSMRFAARAAMGVAIDDTTWREIAEAAASQGIATDGAAR